MKEENFGWLVTFEFREFIPLSYFIKNESIIVAAQEAMAKLAVHPGKLVNYVNNMTTKWVRMSK